MKKPKLVLIGNGMAGVRALDLGEVQVVDADGKPAANK